MVDFLHYCNTKNVKVKRGTPSKFDFWMSLERSIRHDSGVLNSNVYAFFLKFIEKVWTELIRFFGLRIKKWFYLEIENRKRLNINLIFR